MVYPIAVTAPEPAADMPSTVRDIYEEARRVDALSPRGAAGLLRLALQLLVDDLVPGKGQLNAKIGQLVAEGLPTSVQQAMDSVRVIGNGAVHPGQIEIAGSRKDSEVLYRLINFVVEKTITEPKEIEGIFDNLPESQREAIDRRDGKATGGE